ncbi:o-succinylbenzoate--CoA ligase [Haemophilus influenzae]|nr:o-succinylbenzoate--CoA ligase [Haemophilus influenzae]
MYPWQHFAIQPDFSDKIALRTTQGDALTWIELTTKINQTVAFLQKKGVNAESTVAFVGKNSEKILFLYLATIQLGAKVLGINPAFPQEKIAELCESYQIDFCFYDKDLLNLQEINSFTRKANFFRPATMTLTSGSTGLPKAVVHNVQAHLDNAKGVCNLMKFDCNQSWLLSLPLYHVSGQGIVWRWLYCGAQLHFPKDDFYASLLETTHVSLVPTQLQRLLDYLQENSIISFSTRHILLGGTHIPAELTKKIVKYGIETYSGYGMTEMASTVFAKKSDEKQGVGQPLLGREYRLVNDEVWLKGAGLAMGYWKDRQIVSLTNNQGWLPTKDKGVWQEGELVIIGRLDNMFISGGENIQPEEIEQVIIQHSSVNQVFVLPQKNKEFGQRPVALVDFNESFSKSAVENLMFFLQDKLARFKQPIAYYPLPLMLGKGIKISRKQLADWLAKQDKIN